MKKVGNTVPAVKIGCQAGKRCCLKAESVKIIKKSYKYFYYLFFVVYTALTFEITTAVQLYFSNHKI